MTSINQQYCFNHSTGQPVYLFTLKNRKGISVSISNLGAIILSFCYVQNKQSHDIVLGFDKPEDYLDENYLSKYFWMGAAVGRYTNRIGNAQFKLGRKLYKLPQNLGSDCLHGGDNGFDRKVWEVKAFGATPFPFLELQYQSPDGEEGFPGNLQTTIRFELNELNELSYEYKAITDKATPINLTHHSYFNLNNGEGNILDQEVRLHASKILQQNENLVANGKIDPIKGTTHDFKEFQKIGSRIAELQVYDQSYVCDDPRPILKLVAEARSKKSNIQLSVFFIVPILHFYSGKFIPAITGKKGTAYGESSGFCFETHQYCNAVNIPDFPSTILKPGDEYFQKTVYKVSQVLEK